MKTKDGKEVKVGDIVWCHWARPVKIISQPNANSHWYRSEADQNFIWLGDPVTGKYCHVGDVSTHYGEEKNAQAAARDYFQTQVDKFETEAASWITRRNAAASRFNELNMVAA